MIYEPTEPQTLDLPPTKTLAEAHERLEKAIDLLGASYSDLERAWYKHILAVIDEQPDTISHVQQRVQLFRQALLDVGDMERDVTNRILAIGKHAP